jgi:hypothetical protein
MSTDTTEKKQSIAELTTRYTELNTKKIQAETNLKNAEKELQKLQKQARDQNGTDDIAKLKEKLREMEAENEQKRSNYQRDLDKIDADLKATEKKYSDAKDGTQEA